VSGAGARCPFCGAEWSAAMLAALDEATDPAGCRCCGRETARHSPKSPSTREIACAACGKPIYRAVTLPTGSAA
jgi:hypothetical protein